jgi:hypothetical protein
MPVYKVDQFKITGKPDEKQMIDITFRHDFYIKETGPKCV